MAKFTTEEIKMFFDLAVTYFEVRYPNGASIDEIRQAEEHALKKYLNLYSKNLDNGKIRHNSDCKKARNKWFVLETIEKIMDMNNLNFAENLDFCTTEQASQIELFMQTVSREEYESYLEDTDLSK